MNKQFFEKENDEKYYVLGWILSDGHISKSKKFWTIDLHVKDKLMIEKFHILINYDGKIYGPYKNSNKIQTQIRCKEHLNFLTHFWGLDNNKSHNLKWKDCPEKFLPHLVRGYFDGDGCIYTKQSSNPNVRTLGINFVGTHDFIINSPKKPKGL